MDSLAVAATIEELVALLYEFLPASGAPFTFEHAAANAQLTPAWQASTGQSKRQRIRQLLEAGRADRQRFRPLIREIVRGALGYRRAKKNPLTYDEVVRLKDAVAVLGFAMTDLMDPGLTRQLLGAPTASQPGSNAATPAAATAPTQPPAPPAPPVRDRQAGLSRLMGEFLALDAMEDRQAAGQQFNRFLSSLFDLFDLSPSEAFRVVGEEIDGAFYFETAVYLLEAKWTSAKTDAASLYTFNEKIRRKSDYTRGLFVSVHGYTDQALDAYRTGGGARAVLLDGAHIFRVLQGQIDLPALLLRAARHLSEKGQPYLPVADLQSSAGP